jgi:hypothetical protein
MFISIIFIFEAARRAQCIRSIFHRGNLPMISVPKLSINLRVVVADVMWLPLLLLMFADRKGGLRRHQPTTLPRLRGPVVPVPSRENTPRWLSTEIQKKTKRNWLAKCKTELGGSRFRSSPEHLRQHAAIHVGQVEAHYVCNGWRNIDDVNLPNAHSERSAKPHTHSARGE